MTTLARALGQQPRDGAYDSLFRWILLAALMGLGGVICWEYGLIAYVIEADHSRISIVIGALFLGYSAHCLWLVLELSREYRPVLAVVEAVGTGPGPKLEIEGGGFTKLSGVLRRGGLVETYMRDLVPTFTRSAEGDRAVLLQSLGASLRRRTRIGIFGADLLYKLGMLGTMVGFVMMLNSMGDLSDFNVETLREGLQKMIAGMAVSLLTTIVGLIGGILLRLQYNLTEAVATDILQTALRITETGIVPRMTSGAPTHV